MGDATSDPGLTERQARVWTPGDDVRRVRAEAVARLQQTCDRRRRAELEDQIQRLDLDLAASHEDRVRR